MTLLLEDVDIVNNQNETALHSACMRGNHIAIDFLLRHGADVNCLSAQGQTPLEYAVRGGHLRLVSTLCSYGADPRIGNVVDIAKQYRVPEETVSLLEKQLELVNSECMFISLFYHFLTF